MVAATSTKRTPEYSRLNENFATNLLRAGLFQALALIDAGTV
jgi:hypothetical protein